MIEPFSRSRVALCALVASGLAVWGAGASEMDSGLRIDLDRAVAAEVAKIFKTRDDDGVKNHRATFSKRYHRVDDETYRVSLTEDSAEGARMRTERYLLTLKRSGKHQWGVTERELRDVYERLVRSVPGDETFQRFDSFEIDREGLQVRGGPGVLVADTLSGEVVRLQVFADETSWAYEVPPEGTEQQPALHGYLRQTEAKDFEFEPHRVSISCDPETCGEILAAAFSGTAPIERSGLSTAADKHYTETLKEQQDRYREHAFASFQLPREADHRYVRVSVIDKGGAKWVSLSDDNRQAREVTFSAGGYGPLYSYPSKATRDSGISRAEIERRDDADDRDYDMKSLRGTVSMALDGAEHLEADLEYSLIAKRELGEIVFRLQDLSSFVGRGSTDREPSLTVNSLQDGNDEDLTWVRLGTSSGVVVLDPPVPAGSKIVLKMQFENEGSLIKLTPSYSYMDRGGWLPFVRYTDKIDEFELKLRTSDKYKALGVGTKLGEKTTNGVTTTHWLAHDAHFPTVIFGRYFEDEPRTKAAKLDGTPIPVTIHVDRDGMTSWNIRPNQLRPLAEQAVNALNLYREIFGIDYPYGKLDLVNDPTGFLYGQSPASMVYLGSGAFRGEGALQGYSKFVRSLVAHEVGHQWWGSAIGNANARNYWFVESLAEYASALFVEAVNSEGGKKPEKGYKAYLGMVDGWKDRIMEAKMLASVKDSRVLWSGGSYGAALYAKGPYAFHMMRMSVGTEGMYAFLKNLGVHLAGKSIVTSDIEDVASRTFGTDMSWFFDQWIRGAGIPEYTLEYEAFAAEDGTWVIRGSVGQQVVLGPERAAINGLFYEGMVAVSVLGKDRTWYPARLVVSGPETPFQFKVPVEPLDVELNRDGEILAHVRPPTRIR